MRATAYLAIILAGMCLCAPARAYMVIGGGTASCGIWSEARKMHHTNAYYEQWVVGFIAGTAFANPDIGDPLGKLEAGDVHNWIDNFCQKNPTQDIIKGAQAFVEAHKK